MILGTHNTLSAYAPRSVWGWFGLPVAKCQTKNIEKQYKLGVRCFDIRIKYDNELGYPAHGLVSFRNNLYSTFRKLGEWATPEDPIYIRFTLETSHADPIQEAMFIEDCKDLEMFDNIICFNGRRKFDWKKLYTFKNKYEPDVYQLVGSMQSNYGKVFPFLWRIFNRKKVKDAIKTCAENKDHDILLVDFL